MSDTDSESEGDKIRRSRRSVVVKFKFEDTDSSSDDDDDSVSHRPCNSARSAKMKRSRKLPSTDSESDDSAPNPRRIQAASSSSASIKRRDCHARPYILDMDDSSDSSWSPFDAAVTAAGGTVRTGTRSPRPIRASTSSLYELGPSTSSPHKATHRLADVQSDAGSSSDDATEKCPICLHSFRDQEIGMPNVCEHNYCVPCIDEWSKNVQTCPIDRKPFTTIRVRANLDSSDCLREIQVRADSSGPKTDLDITHCEICNLSDREDTMLLCDGCDQGYHMECLIPAMTEIPEGSWYCDNCFGSDTSEEDISQLIEEMESEVGIPETRLRVRRVAVPRITRTRQSERIRATILSRRLGGESDAASDAAVPGSSHITTTTSGTTTTRRRMPATAAMAAKPRKTTRRRRKARRRRTYVVEYDVDNFDNKFSIKTTRKTIRRRRKTKRKTASRRGRCSSKRATNENENADRTGALCTHRSLVRSIEANYPKLHLFGAKNALEYFPDDDTENDGEPDLYGPDGSFGGAGGGRGEALVMSSARFAVGVNRGLLKRKQIGAVRRRPTATVTNESMASADLLSNIIDTMDRWYSMSKADNVDRIKIDADGKLSIDDARSNPSKACPVSTPSKSDILNAPRGGPANDGNIQIGSSFQNNNGNRAGNGGSSYSIGGNGMSTDGSNASIAIGDNANRQGGGIGGEGAGDFASDSIDSINEQPRNRIMTRRRSKSALGAPPSVNDFPALISCPPPPIPEIDGLDLTMSSANQRTTAAPSQVTNRRKSTLAPPPSLDDFPALSGTNQSIPANNELIPAECPPGLRRKGTLAPPPSLDGFPALSGHALISIDEVVATPQVSTSHDSEAPRRIMTRRRSNQAPPLTLDAGFNVLNVDAGATESHQPSRVMTRRRSSTLAPPPSIIGFPALLEPMSEADVPDEACPPPPVPDIEGIFDDDDDDNEASRGHFAYQPPPISNYSARKSNRNRNRKQESTTSQSYNYTLPLIPTYGSMSIVGAGGSASATVPQPSSAPLQASPSLAMPVMVPPPTALPFSAAPPFEPPTSLGKPSTETVSLTKIVKTKKHAANERTYKPTLIPDASVQPVEETIALPSPLNLNHKPTKITWKNNPLKKKSIFTTSDDEDGGFQYSAESLEVAIKKHDAKNQKCEKKKLTDESKPANESNEEMERDEDLVQLDDDDETTSDQISADKRTESTEDVDQSLAAKKNILDLHDDSDWEELRDDKLEDKAPSQKSQAAQKPEEEQNIQEESSHTPKEKPSAHLDDESDETVENERSYTPCLDEQVVHDANEKSATTEFEECASSHIPDQIDTQSRQGRTSTGIDNMDTELISDDDDNDLLRDEQSIKKDGAKKAKKKKKTSSNSKERENEEEFRKISKSNKERRYREQRRKHSGSGSRSPSKRRTRSISRSLSRSRSRSRSRSKSRSRSRHRGSRSWSRNRRFNNGINNRGRRTLNQRFGRNTKRREIQRYNVRNVVLDRQSRNHKDQYGRDEARTNRSPSRSPTPRRRSPARHSFSVSRSRSRSPYRRRRASLDNRASLPRSISPQRRSIRSLSRSLSPRFNRHSHSPLEATNGATRSVSGSPHHRSGKAKTRKLKKKSGDKKSSKRRTKRRKTRDGSPSGAESQYVERPRIRSRSWGENNRNKSWSRSVSPQPVRRSPEPNESWTPPIGQASENLRITLANREKKRRREKKKKDKHRSEQRKEKKRQRTETHVVTNNRPSKEVFASGDNILVSVSFNKEKEKTTQQQTTIVTLPPSKDQIQTKKQNERNKRSNKDPSRKRKKLNVKPVAIIDLDNSPFKEMTPSPRAVIILSDSDHEHESNKENTNQQRSGLPATADQSQNIGPLDEPQEHVVEVVNSPPASPTMNENESFELLSMGPKTPPEPRLIKFALPKAKVRTVANPLHDTADDQNEGEPIEPDAASSQEQPQSSQTQPNKTAGPNTPSDMGPYSPDVYDPFEPTKSPSPTPPLMSESVLQPAESSSNIDHGAKRLEKPLADNETGDKENNAEVIILSPRKEKATPDDTSATKTSSIHVFSNILLAPGLDSLARTQPQTQRSLTLFPVPTTSNIISPSKASHSQPAKPSPMKFGTSLLSRLPLPQTSKLPKPNRHNGNDDGGEGDSPYSPQSSDYDDLFDPPSLSPGTTAKKSSGNNRGAAAGGGVLDELFGSSSPPHPKLSKSSLKTSKSSKHHKKSSIKEWLAVNKQSTQSSFGKPQNDQNRILDDIPASAVELQAKDKYLRKLNRQERVVEEVKLILKPHYNRKNITKEEYKDIMRRAVPKICHNPTGEINPKKIKNLIEAYVKKFRYRRKNAAAAPK